MSEANGSDDVPAVGREPTSDELRSRALVRFCGDPLSNLTKFVPLVFLAYFLKEPIVEVAKALAVVAGTETSVNLQAQGAVTYNEVASCDYSLYLWVSALSVLFGFFCLLHAKREKQAKQDVIEEKAKRIEHLEKMIDPGRSSCGLTGRGDTSPGDK